MMMENNYKVWFISDLHISHKGILKHEPKRIEVMGLTDENDIENHDKYIIDLWLKTIGKGDHVYVLGDMILSSQEHAIKILNKLKSNGRQIHLIVGNHDKSLRNLHRYFSSIDIERVVEFKKTKFPFIEENKFTCVLNHCPLKSWVGKNQGSMQLYGHVHDNAPWIDEGNDLCMNVGFDAHHSNFQLISLEQVYAFYKSKLGGLTPYEYLRKVREEDKYFIR